MTEASTAASVGDMWRSDCCSSSIFTITTGADPVVGVDIDVSAENAGGLGVLTDRADGAVTSRS